MHLYEEIRTEILRRINSQAWPAGFSVPHEEKLAEEFGVARGTIRRALASLVDAGLIERRRRAGTRVVGRKSHSSTLTIPVVRHEIESNGQAYGYKLLASTLCGPDRDDQGLFTDAPLRHILSLHLSDGRPYQLEDRLVNLSAIPEAKDADFSTVSPNEWLIARVPYSSVRTTLRAELASAADSRYLKLKRNEPVFVIERKTQLNGAALTHVRMAHPASSFQMITATDGLR
jgi:GntR family histidine utilization transcriptional repressor